MRIDKYLADAGLGTRSEVKKMIRNRMVSVDENVVMDCAYQVALHNHITVNGQAVSCEEFVYYMLHKPAGVVSATRDTKEKTVVDLITEHRRRDLFPVGRLDKDTEGLLLITNDGKLGHNLLHPRKHVDKTYYAKIKGCVTKEHVEAFAEGFSIGDEKDTEPARLEILKSGDESEIEITITEGRYHQIKRMFEAHDRKVLYLKRLRMGTLQLDETLAPGQYRRLTAQELKELEEEYGTTKE